ncbi:MULTISPECIES: DUF1302 domain-containing protein [Hydrocarboniphaga]|jgi:hypothetical protein|uniref:DUF1302 family protein n=1 Tax=Hydrocarboniphaga effusa AP103 TaxID=1172194 RepID=I8T1U3_9GAMM|nr:MULTISPECIES: DUF1302 family protein [Hydrocarboniphaga]EIT67885.1 hypothetical protein WQQ_43200 [Hydrocarboniphaga effusa AP103]MDZ4077942.1 DUF1302 family protein [Hydrocarboniphaga sp.]
MMVTGNMSRRYAAMAMTATALSCAIPAHAGSIDVGDEASLDYKLTVGYAFAMRTEKRSNALVNGDVDPFRLFVLPTQQPGQPFQLAGFSNTGLPTTINFDDGNRNFDKWAPINNRLSALLELNYTHGPYGIVASADGFYDHVYREGSNDNDSPGTVNKFGDNDRFTKETRRYQGSRARLLDAYVYGDWNLFGDVNLNLRAGKHVVAWGESLFFPGISGAQSTADATKAFVPGAEIKAILLPTNQLSMQMSLTPESSLLAYYKLAFRPNQIFPVGDYFSPSDAVGPGASFVYGSANPVSYLGNCPGLLQNISILGTSLPPIIPPGLESLICSQILAPIGNAAGAPAYIYAYRAEDLRPSAHGQYGVGLKHQFSNMQVGLYFLRYSDPNPTVQLNFGYAPFTTNPEITTQIVNQQVPTTYNVKYWDGIHLYGASFSTVAGPFNIGGDIIYRDGAAMPAQAYVSGVLSPIYTRGREGSVQMSAIYVTNPGWLFDDLSWVTEVAYHHLFGLDQVDSRPGQIMVGDGGVSFYDEDAVGFQTLVIPTRHNVVQGWDVSTPITVASLVKGTPALAGAFGALYGDGDTRVSLSVQFTRLQNLQIGVGYNFFFGNVNKTIGDSTLKANPYTDRDYATFSAKYNF